ncbi:DIP1984 family protein [Kineococcus sp. SYSU DK001]|uniref:DIP1984 family protein n=1 Tax=Kineococcus sp. SYSU DK001 TaxID=3383122 RepID=UPI003D7D9FD0
MKLAEALTERADAQRRVEQLRSRITANARYQEGEEPAEDAAALLAEAEQVLTRLRTLIARINRTNSTVDLGPDGTMTDALATRDVLRLRHSVLTSAADAASGHGVRQLRSELRQLTALPVKALRAQADDVARELRTLDGRIQQANWTHELLEQGPVGSR